MIYRLAPPDMRMYGQEIKYEYVGLTEVTYCTRDFLNKKVRYAFEMRTNNYYFSIQTKSGRRYKGGKISSWSSDAAIGFMIDQQFYSVPVEEIVEMIFGVFPK